MPSARLEGPERAWSLGFGCPGGGCVVQESQCGLSGLWVGPPLAPPSVRMRPDSLVMAAPEGSLRKRKVGGAAQRPVSPPSPPLDPGGSPARLRTGTFWLTRVVLLKALAFIYCECPVGAGCRPHPGTWSQPLLTSGLLLASLYASRTLHFNHSALL